MGNFLTNHVKERCQKRGISMRAVNFILKNYEKKYTRGADIFMEGKFEGEDIRLVAKPDRQHLIIVTAYKL